MYKTIAVLTLSFLCINPSAASAAFKLPDTGQSKCYQIVLPFEIPCDGTGQDGAYTINPPSYSDNGNGTVTDNNTGLMWQKEDDNQIYNWYQASGTYDETYNPSSQSVCGSLNLGDHTDWRLPTNRELMSIVDYSILGPSINQTYFPYTKADVDDSYWTSTTVAGLPGIARKIYFGVGSGSIGDKGNSQNYNYYVRCLRGGQIAQNFTDNGNGTVTENNTGLTWQQGEPGAMTWVSALSYCEGLSLGDHSDWRLPNIRELESLTDYTRFNPAIDKSFFPNASAAYYWSSTTSAGGPAGAWYVDFFFIGGFIYGYKGDGYYVVRCVSGGQSGPSINLTVNLSGVGSGMINNINPDGPAFSCSTPSLSCSALFAAGTSFILHPTPSTNYSFDRWSNGTGSASECSGTGDCSFTLSATSSVTAKFDPDPLVKVLPSHPDIVYQTLQGAYNEAINSDQLKARNIVFSDSSFTLNRGTNISLKGGLESDFSSINGYSYLQGVLTLVSGSLTVENLCIK